jgi:hypothetical protein
MQQGRMAVVLPPFIGPERWWMGGERVDRRGGNLSFDFNVIKGEGEAGRCRLGGGNEGDKMPVWFGYSQVVAGDARRSSGSR